jgi:hypothetical protein
MSIPVALVSLMLLYQISNSVGPSPLYEGPFSASPLATQLADIRSIYAIDNVKKVADGPEPFPENQQSLRSGISIEFRLIVYFMLYRRF